jgi:hypothetical protein
MPTLDTRVHQIEIRNQRVEQDKAWETSWTRRISIAALTYAVVVSYLYMIDNDSPWVNGLVPVAGFLLSTLALGFIRKMWERT